MRYPVVGIAGEDDAMLLIYRRPGSSVTLVTWVRSAELDIASPVGFVLPNSI